MSTSIQQYEVVDGKAIQVYPCRCGQTHKGEYALEDWLHHNCFHDEILSIIADDESMCMQCGQVFHLVDDRGIKVDA